VLRDIPWDGQPGCAWRFAEGAVQQQVGLFLCPFQAAPFAIHPQPQRVLLPRRKLEAPEHAARATGVAQQEMRVVNPR
jgi:hypothetical protein